MLHKRQSFGTRKVSPPQPTFMTEDQKATYLKDLRTNRPARPVGSRPLPSKPSIPKLHREQNGTLPSKGPVSRLAEGETLYVSKRHSMPAIASLDTAKGRPLVQAPDSVSAMRKVTPPELRYRESSAREREKKEAHLLRRALEERDFQHEEGKIYQAAQLEAADLVWKHRNPELANQEIHAPYRNPDISRKRYKILTEGSALDQITSAHGALSPADSNNAMADNFKPLKVTKRTTPEVTQADAFNDELGNRRRSSGTRKVSNRSLFRNPADQIFEEPSQSEQKLNGHKIENSPLQSTTHNPHLRRSRPLPAKPYVAKAPYVSDSSESDRGKYNSRPLPGADALPFHAGKSTSPPETVHQQLPIMEIRSEEIRAATSMRRSDRSPHLPTPTAVSDRPGRPIVSFDPEWKARSGTSNALESKKTTTRSLPLRPSHNSADTQTIPTINLPEDESVPQIQISADHVVNQSSSPSGSEVKSSRKVSDPALRTHQKRVNNENRISGHIPSISIESGEKSNIEPLRKPTVAQVSTDSSTSSKRPERKVPWLSRGPNVPTIAGERASAVSCTGCRQPISTHVVTASGADSSQKAQFHPWCFTCFHCNTDLECVSFYPEPEAARQERLGLSGSSDELRSLDQQQHLLEKGADLRFFCHLDYHNLYSPRCGSCHTPIEGAVILAAGKSWHEGHFFCAECGDPFSSSSPFVESQGYAYCVGCHTKRTSARCRACKKQILDDVSVEALGGKWHEDCFNCDECHGDFGDEGRFFVREVEVELTEKEKRKGVINGKVEERAVCERCEQRRLKSRDVAAFL